MAYFFGPPCRLRSTYPNGLSCSQECVHDSVMCAKCWKRTFCCASLHKLQCIVNAIYCNFWGDEVCMCVCVCVYSRGAVCVCGNRAQDNAESRRAAFRQRRIRFHQHRSVQHVRILIYLSVCLSVWLYHRSVSSSFSVRLTRTYTEELLIISRSFRNCVLEERFWPFEFVARYEKRCAKIFLNVNMVKTLTPTSLSTEGSLRARRRFFCILRYLKYVKTRQMVLQAIKDVVRIVCSITFLVL